MSQHVIAMGHTSAVMAMRKYEDRDDNVEAMSFSAEKLN